MHARIEETLEYIDTERAELRAAVELVPPALREQPPGPDRWSVAQVLQHLSLTENQVGRLVNKRIVGARAEGLGPELETSPVLDTKQAARIADRSHRATAPEDISAPADVDAASAWAALEQSRKALRAAVLSGDGLALSEVKHSHPAVGEIDLYQWILFVGSHEARHAAQIREIADQLKADSTTAASAN